MELFRSVKVKESSAQPCAPRSPVGDMALTMARSQRWPCSIPLSLCSPGLPDHVMAWLISPLMYRLEFVFKSYSAFLQTLNLAVCIQFYTRVCKSWFMFSAVTL